jgi:hypothetical protein
VVAWSDVEDIEESGPLSPDVVCRVDNGATVIAVVRPVNAVRSVGQGESAVSRAPFSLLLIVNITAATLCCQVVSSWMVA